MARKKKVVETKIFSKEEIQAALEISHSEYFMNILALLSHDPEQNFLNYVKVPVVTPGGGTYLISILHIDGPKIDLRELSIAAESKEAEVKS